MLRPGTRACSPIRQREPKALNSHPRRKQDRTIMNHEPNNDPLSKIKHKLQDEISALEHELNLELPKELMKARAHGDLSENAEYKYAKERQGFVSARLGQLKKRM